MPAVSAERAQWLAINILPLEPQLRGWLSALPHMRLKLTAEGQNLAKLTHPHPSGVAEPSQADEQITRRLRDALSLVDIGILDHRRCRRLHNQHGRKRALMSPKLYVELSAAAWPASDSKNMRGNT